MNTKYLIGIILLIMLSGCGGKKYRYYTRINPDGSIFKQVVFTGDSAVVHGKPFPFVIDENWKVNYRKEYNDKDSDSVFVAIAERTFITVDQLQNVFSHAVDSMPKEDILFEFNSSFKWFFSYHTYRETFNQQFPAKLVSIDNYLSEKEQLYIFGEDKSLELGLNEKQIKELEEKCTNKWLDYLSESAYLEYMQILREYTSKKQIAGISDALGEKIRPYFNMENDNVSCDSVCRLIDSITGLNMASDAYMEGAFDGFIQTFEKSDWHENGDNSYEFEIESPGLVFDSNGQLIEGNKVKWTFKGEQFQYKDYVMYVSYRTTNIWTIVLSILLFAGVAGWLFFKRNK